MAFNKFDGWVGVPRALSLDAEPGSIFTVLNKIEGTLAESNPNENLGYLTDAVTNMNAGPAPVDFGPRLEKLLHSGKEIGSAIREGGTKERFFAWFHELESVSAELVKELSTRRRIPPR